MYKHLFSIILVLVMVCPMPACSSNTESFKETSTVSITSNEPFEEKPNTLNQENVTSNINNQSIDLISPITFSKMSVNDIEIFMNEMVNISSTNTLSISDMLHMGHNFNNIFSSVSGIDVNVFETYVVNGFDNVYNQCIEQNIPLEKISSWTNIPVTEVQVKYFSSEFSFDKEMLNCQALYFLNENDALKVAETIFNNSTLFENCAGLIYSSITCPHQKVQQLALDVLTTLSTTSNEINSSVTFSYCLILDTNSIRNDVFTVEMLNQIRKNILDNPHWDFIMKFYVFCNSNDELVSNWAKDVLANIAKHCDENTEENIIKLIPYLNDVPFSNDLLKLLDQC